MKGEQRKQQVLVSSISLFSSRGYYQTHVEDVIKEAKVGKGTFYRYFRNKEELFIGLLMHFLNEWEKTAFIDPKDLTTEGINGHFRELIRRSFTFFRDNEDLCNIYLRVGPGLSKVFEPYMRKFEDRMLDYIAAYLKEAIHLGYLRELDIELTSNMIAGSFLRLDYYYFVLMKDSGKPADVDAITDRFFDIVIKGIGA